MKNKVIVFILAVLVVGAYVIAQDDFFPSSEYVEVEDIKVTGQTISVSVGCKAMVADTSPERAKAIQDGLSGKIETRPNTHDIFVKTLDAFNISIVSMAIENRDDKFYYTNLVLRGGNKVLKLDMKPSDGMAFALRAGAPIYINRTLLEVDGIDIC